MQQSGWPLAVQTRRRALQMTSPIRSRIRSVLQLRGSHALGRSTSGQILTTTAPQVVPAGLTTPPVGQRRHLRRVHMSACCDEILLLMRGHVTRSPCSQPQGSKWCLLAHTSSGLPAAGKSAASHCRVGKTSGQRFASQCLVCTAGKQPQTQFAHSRVPALHV